MKKTMKKYLILALVVMTMLALAFCVSAADGSMYCSECKQFVTNTVTGKTYPAKCETEGYTEVLCNQGVLDENGKVKLDDNGEIIRCRTLVGRTDVSGPDGHIEVIGYELQGTSSNGYYLHSTTCSRVVNGNSCNYKKFAEYEDHTPIKYYKVTYVNNFAADTIETDVKYTSLAASYKTEELFTEYIKEATIGTKVPEAYRMPDKTCGEYKFVGWKIGDAAAKKTLSVPVEGMTVADYVATAEFAALTNVTHSVTFYTERGAVIITLNGANAITHGASIDEYLIDEINSKAPLKADNVEYKYSFDYWTLLEIIGKFDLNQPIYGDLELKAHYAETLKRYELKYFDRHGKALKDDVSDFVNIAGFGTSEREKPLNAIEIKKNPAKYGMEANYFDAAYDYNFTGNWLIDGRDNTVIDIEHVDLPDDILDYSQTNSYIKVVPQYRKIARLYDLTVYVTYEDDLNPHPGEIDIQITDADGNPIAVATLTEKDIVEETKNSRTPTYKKVFKVRYSSSYRVVATSRNYKGERTPLFIIDGTSYESYRPGGCSILMTRIADKPCGCICHSIFKPVWVGILNILYNLFKAEFVCCDDMFANIGDSLVYGPSKS